jgi:hypothetical protein
LFGGSDAPPAVPLDAEPAAPTGPAPAAPVAGAPPATPAAGVAGAPPAPPLLAFTPPTFELPLPAAPFAMGVLLLLPSGREPPTAPVGEFTVLFGVVGEDCEGFCAPFAGPM